MSLPGMNNIQNISFPRSGHHLLERCMKDLFAGQIHYCDYYRHCRKIPCPDPQTNYQKNHDFKLTVSIDSQFHYLVQIRNPLQATTSWYTAELKHRHKKRIGEGAVKRGIKLSLLSDSYTHWRFFLVKSLRYWRKFVKKWVLSNIQAPHMVVLYETLIEDPVQELGRVAEFVSSQIAFDQGLIERVVTEQKITVTRDISEFKYFDLGLFSKIESSLESDYARLGISRVT